MSHTCAPRSASSAEIRPMVRDQARSGKSSSGTQVKVPSGPAPEPPPTAAPTRCAPRPHCTENANQRPGPEARRPPPPRRRAGAGRLQYIQMRNFGETLT
eukprot:scaffold836_cov123-Isochrysis_galbana.AAC.11